jgi:hypothetical protein
MRAACGAWRPPSARCRMRVLPSTLVCVCWGTRVDARYKLLNEQFGLQGLSEERMKEIGHRGNGVSHGSRANLSRPI